MQGIWLACLLRAPLNGVACRGAARNVAVVSWGGVVPERLQACGAPRITRAGMRGSSQTLVAEDQLRHFFDLAGDLNALPGSAFLLQIQPAQLMATLPGLFCAVSGGSLRQYLWMVRA